MKPTHTIILLLIGVILSNPLFGNNIDSKISQLQPLFDRNITYTDELPLDSLIKWGEEENSLLLLQKQTEFFEFELLMVNGYCAREDISLAIDRVHRMLNKAFELNFTPGIILAGIGIGDTYAYSNMLDEAITSYKEALQMLENLPGKQSVKYMKKVLLQLTNTLLKKNNLEEASLYLTKLNDLYTNNANKEEDPLYAYVLLCNSFYLIATEQLDEAGNYLANAQAIIENESSSFRNTTLHLAIASYYEKKGDYYAALQEYKKFTSQAENKFPANRYTNLILKKAKLYSKMGLINDAVSLYQDILATKDSLNATSYARQVNTLRTIYQVNQMELENQAQRNKYTRLFIEIVLLILLFVILLSVYINKSNKKLAKSREELKSAKNRAESSIKTKSMILSNMSHELRTPLNAMSGFSAILAEAPYIDNETRLQCSEIIQQNSELLLKLIDDVIDLSSLEFGKMQFNFGNHDAVKICKNVTETVNKVKQTSAQIIFRSSLNELILYTDESRLQQVLINLMINATKFTPEGEITLELSLNPDNLALFSVTDTGCGIPPEKQKKIFNRFEKLNESAQGTGLGLSICQLIINHVGGDIWIDPEYTKGSRFCFTHPLNNSINKE